MKKINQFWKISQHLRGIAIIYVIAGHLIQNLLISRSSLDIPSSFYIFSNDKWMVFHGFVHPAVPIFFFLAGYFMISLPPSWMAIWKGLRKLLYPYLFWSLVSLLMTWILGYGMELTTFLLQLVQGQVLVYWFIFLLMQYYLVLKFLIFSVRNYPKLSLVISFIVQIIILIINYNIWFRFIGGEWAFGGYKAILARAFFPNYIFCVVSGMLVKQYPDVFKKIINKKFTTLLIIIVFIISIVSTRNEILWIFRDLSLKTDYNFVLKMWTTMGTWKASNFIYSVSSVLVLVLIGQVWLPSSKILVKLGSYAYTIYLTHMFFEIFFSGILKHIYQPLLGNVFGFIILFILVIVPPILFAEFVKNYLPKLSLILLGD